MATDRTVVVFDVGGVLLDFNNSLEKLSQKLDIPYEECKDHWSRLDPLICKGQLSTDEFLNKLDSDYQPSSNNFDFVDFWVEHFIPIESMHKLVKELALTHKIGLLTNIFSNVLEKSITEGKIPQLNYNFILESNKAGLVKPNPEIFKHFTKIFSLNPSQILLIDDNIENIKTAKSLGWHGFHYQGGDSTKDIKDLIYELDEA